MSNTEQTFKDSRSGRLPRWNRYVNRLIAAEISAITRYYDRVIQWHPRREDTGFLLDEIDAPEKKMIKDGEKFPKLSKERETRSAILLNGTFNHHYDIQGLLMELKGSLARTSRLLIVAYNPYFNSLYKIANLLGIRRGELPTTFVTAVDLENIARLAGYSLVRVRPLVYLPWPLIGMTCFVNRLLAIVPFLRRFSFANLIVLRPIIAERRHKPSLSCVIPARNEKGNIEEAIKRMPDLGCDLELIFVEGCSNDGTWKEILRVQEKYKEQFNIKAFQQSGSGKSDAVRLGFSESSGELLTILDADLTMPPEQLARYYDAYCEGKADFINGSRLVYPIEGDEMRFLNRLGNVFFAKVLSWVLDVRISDSLCGTKLLARRDYERMIAWRRDFGDFDPFGDFELIFPAAVLALDIVDIPIRYKKRTYGSTNIRRFRHGLMLFRMALVGLSRIRMGARIGNR